MSKNLTRQGAKEAIIKPTVGGYTRAEIATTAMAEFNAAFEAAMDGEPYEQVEIEPEFARSLLAVEPTGDVRSITQASHVWGADYGWVELEEGND